MKKTILTSIAVFISICGYSQTIYDPAAYEALLFSENEYEGTARSVALGNAFTALGGDLGSIGLNPAGSAVAGYSQITFTPAITFAASTAVGNSPYDNGFLPYFQKEYRNRIPDYMTSNIGIMFNYNTHRKSGLKNFTLGFVANKTACYDEDMYTSGTNNATSFMGAMAYEATNYYYDPDIDQFFGLSKTELNKASAYNDGLPWKYVMGYKSGMISPLEGYEDWYAGASQVTFNGEVSLGGPIDQAFGKKVDGGKCDYVFNMGANISDFIYIGANFGISTLDYSYKEYFKEAAKNHEDFEILLDNNTVIYFNEMKYRYSYNVDGSGYYGKLGVIVTPGYGLRIGAAIQTPTINFYTERWKYTGETSYTGSYNASSDSPEGINDYKMVSPFRANFGVALTLGQFGLISADYEICDYGSMRYKVSGFDSDREFYAGVNDVIREYFRASQMLRTGIEIKPTAGFAIRAGYGFTTSPEEYVYHDDSMSIFKYQNYSFGLGYSSRKSFFADFAVKNTLLPTEYIRPYADYEYVGFEDGTVGVNPNAYAPEIVNRRSLWKVLVTLGWRF